MTNDLKSNITLNGSTFPRLFFSRRNMATLRYSIHTSNLNINYMYVWQISRNRSALSLGNWESSVVRTLNLMSHKLCRTYTETTEVLSKSFYGWTPYLYSWCEWLKGKPISLPLVLQFKSESRDTVGLIQC